MFAPIGYRLFIDFFNVIEEAVNIRQSHNSSYSQSLNESDSTDTEMSEDSQFTVWAFWILQTYALKKNIQFFACSPDGEIFEISRRLVCYANDVCEQFDPRVSCSNWTEYLDAADLSHVFVDATTGTLDVESNLVFGKGRRGELSIESIEKKFLFEKKLVESADPSSPHLMDDKKLLAEWEIFIEQLKIARKIRHLHGWAICVKEEDFINNPVELIKYVECSANKKSKLGRPTKRDIAKDAFQHLYPAGRGGVGWKKVLLEIEQYCGLKVDLTTLKRGLGIRED